MISPIIISGSTLKKIEIHNLFSVCVMDGGGGGEGGIRVRASRCNNNISYISISSDLCLEYQNFYSMADLSGKNMYVLRFPLYTVPTRTFCCL